MRVWDILQDHKGFLWIATGDGLNRYDGHRFTVFRAHGPGTLSHDQVWSLCEDQAGTLWVGTYRGGLNRFDSATQTFTHYRHDPDDPASLGDDDIRAIYESPREPGILWIATYGGGLDRFDTQAEIFTHYRHDPDDPASLPHDIVYALYEDQEGTLWAGTGGGLAQVVRHPTPEQTPEAISFITYRPPSVSTNPSSPLAVNAIQEDHTGALWMGTSGAGLFRFDQDTGMFTHFEHDPADPTSLSHNRVLTLLKDREDRFWIGTYGGGLNRFDHATETFIHYQHDPDDQASLSRDIIRALYQDRSGVVWAGSFRGGTLKILPEKFITYLHEQNNPNSLLPPGSVVTIAEDRERGLWVGMHDGGLTHITGAEGATPVYRHYLPDASGPNTLSHPLVLTILETDQEPGVIWLGTERGLNRLDRRTRAIAHYLHNPDDPTSLDDDHVHVLRESLCEPGVLWVGTNRGLNRFDWRRSGFTTVFSIDDLPDPDRRRSLLESGMMRDLYISPSEPCVLWFTVRNYGLYKLTQVPPSSSTDAVSPHAYEIEHYPHGTDLNLNTDEYDLALWGQTNDGRLWLSELTGLFAVDPETKSFTAYTVGDGLPSNRVYSVLLDDQDLLWIATTEGITRMDPLAKTFLNYDITDDLQSNAFQGRAAAKGPSGTLYFGGVKGLTVIYPERIRENTEAPPIVFTDFRLFNESVPINAQGSQSQGEYALPRHISETDALVLPHRASVLTFDFAALDFTAPQKNQYAYMMEGFDEAWTQAGTRHSVTYTNLDHDTYIFRVKGSNNDGLWNEEGARLAITITPPWYQTWWAYAVYTLLVVGGVGGFIYMRGRRLQLRARELEAIVTERTEQLARQAEGLHKANELKSRFLANISHEFRTPLTLTFGPLDDLLQGRYHIEEAARPHIERARRNGSRLLRLINQLLDLSKLDAGALVLHLRRQDMAEHLRQLAALFDSIAQAQGIDYSKRIPSEPLLHVYDRDKLEKVVVNLLSNAFKFTPRGRKVALSLEREDDGPVRLIVADTGPGIAQEHLAHLFDRFYQVEGTSTRSHEGSGIGLALVKELVELHEGTIDVESQVGFGTRFTVCLPRLDHIDADEAGPIDVDEPRPGETNDAAPWEAAPDEAERIDHTISGSLRIAPPAAPDEVLPEDATVVLIVEDNIDMRAYIRAHLEDHFTILEAENGCLGLERAREVVPDLVLSDVMMPEMDGLDLCAALKADTTTSHIPVVLLTAKAQVEHRIAGYESGADAYLPKPFNAQEVQVRVRTLVEERRRLRARFAGDGPLGGDAADDGGVPERATSALPAREAAFLANVQQVIEAHLSDPQFGVERLAEEMLMSRRQLFRKLGALIEETPAALVRRRRLERAAELLRAGELSVKEVCFAVGFQSDSSFGRAFRQHYGVAPSLYATPPEDTT